ncbi:unnamed protein product [Cuscuta campestris]|uniref:Uncharacterized protein n=1 Tax=Cuscuta campestris TaxID=132261 RepID=A0A484KEN9_9ASTE|nr:unnamed protein product [Cuscuta campestris]
MGDEEHLVKNNSMSLKCPMLTSVNYTIQAMRIQAIFNFHGVWDAIEPGTEVGAKKNNMAVSLLLESIVE